MTTRVLVADDQALVRAGFRLILDAQPDIEVVGEAADGVQALAKAAKLRPDLVLMDIRMPEMDGISATRQLAGPGVDRPTKVVILTTYDLDEYVFDALASGAAGFLLKDVPPEDLIRGVRTVAAGDALLAPAITRRLIAEFVARPSREESTAKRSEELASLTQREDEVLRLLARGLSNAEISATLYISENTVKTHVTRVLDKLSLRDRVQAVIFAYEIGLIEPGQS
jgi:DNA-binding NarL/FixJ family response regulator